MGFVDNYAPCGLSPQTDGMPVIQKKCQKHFHAPDTQVGEVTCVCLTVHRKDTHILATGRYRVSNVV